MVGAVDVWLLRYDITSSKLLFLIEKILLTCDGRGIFWLMYFCLLLVEDSSWLMKFVYDWVEINSERFENILLPLNLKETWAFEKIVVNSKTFNVDSRGEKERLQDKGTFLEREIKRLFNSKHSNRHLKLFFFFLAIESWTVFYGLQLDYQYR